MKFSGHKFAYERIESMRDVYVDHKLDSDHKCAFREMTKLIGS